MNIVTVSYEVPETAFESIKKYVDESFDNSPQYDLGVSLNGATCVVERGDFTSVCIPSDMYAASRIMSGINAIFDCDF